MRKQSVKDLRDGVVMHSHAIVKTRGMDATFRLWNVPRVVAHLFLDPRQ